MNQNGDRRRFSRRSLERPVSFYCFDDQGRVDWCLGMIRDAGGGGIRVRARQRVILHRGQRLTLLCMPEQEGPGQDTQPVRLQGRVAWQGGDGRDFGICYE